MNPFTLREKIIVLFAIFASILFLLVGFIEGITFSIHKAEEIVSTIPNGIISNLHVSINESVLVSELNKTIIPELKKYG